MGKNVTPCVGVWIETLIYANIQSNRAVTPCVGVWIETGMRLERFTFSTVTPCVGVWIETLRLPMVYTMSRSHTLRGCVD